MRVNHPLLLFIYLFMKVLIEIGKYISMGGMKVKFFPKIQIKLNLNLKLGKSENFMKGCLNHINNWR